METDKQFMQEQQRAVERKFAKASSLMALALAEQHNYPQLMVKCVEFIVSTPAILDAVLATDGYKHLVASCPMVLPELLKSARGISRVTIRVNASLHVFSLCLSNLLHHLKLKTYAHYMYVMSNLLLEFALVFDLIQG
ncbi:unnamed protein product [Triticum turgidum subsp. durum]|uniref:BPM/SPOP BACK domain-containing protein n=1 Tax=Triticum turgidum subsp. durum TaxID=4567 RepID=A0A9R0ZNW9_TRITD|nr:unnamed protein product [Triticum turgidum subsp. durum]